jgi:hypothetical protein
MLRVLGLSACNLHGARSDTLISKKTEKNVAIGSCVSRGAVPRAATMRLPGLNVNLKLATSSTKLASTLTFSSPRCSEIKLYLCLPDRSANVV